MAVRIGELLLKEKRITPEQLQEALNYQKANGGKLGFNLVKLGFVKDEEITALLSKQYGVPSINLAQFEIDPAVIKLIPAETAQKYQIIPLSRAGATLTIAMTDPTNVFAMDDIKFMTGYNVEPVVASETAVGDAIMRYYALGRPSRRPAGDDRAERPEHARDGQPRRLEELSIARGADDVEVLEELEEISAEALEQAGRGGAGHQARQRRADVGHPEGRERHPHRAVREGAPRPLPHRRHSLQHHERRR